MSEERLLPSQLEDVQRVIRICRFASSEQLNEVVPVLEDLRKEIRACWADLAVATAAMKQRADELALLRAIALAVAEEESLSTATESAAFAALRDWQKWKREG